MSNYRRNPSAVPTPRPGGTAPNSPYANSEQQFEHIPTVTDQALNKQIPPDAMRRFTDHVEHTRRTNEEIMTALDEDLRARNTIDINEWPKYSVLFRKSFADTGLTYDQFLSLSREYEHRFDMQSDIHVVDKINPNNSFTIPKRLKTIVPKRSTDPAQTIFLNEGNSPFKGTANAAAEVLAVSILSEQKQLLVDAPKERLETAKIIVDTLQKVHKKPVTAIRIDGQDIHATHGSTDSSDSTQPTEQTSNGATVINSDEIDLFD